MKKKYLTSKRLRIGDCKVKHYHEIEVDDVNIRKKQRKGMADEV